MISRREVLAAASCAAIAGLAGCSAGASGGSDTIDCQTTAREHGSGDVLNAGVTVSKHEDTVRLAVPLSVSTVRANDVDHVELYRSGTELASTIPVSPEDADLMARKDAVADGQLVYQQTLGDWPLHGQYRVVAVNTAGELVDFVEIEFNCFGETIS